MKTLLKISKIILKYILIFIIVLLIAFGLLVATAKIPKQAIMKNMQESVSFFKENAGMDEIQKSDNYCYLHSSDICRMFKL